MKWSTEAPKDSGFYWAKLSIFLYRYRDEDYTEESTQPIKYDFESGEICVFEYDPCNSLYKDSVVLWGDKLEVPE